LANNFHDEYERAVELLPDFGTSLKSLLERLLAEEVEKGKLRVHAVTYRVKPEASAAQKIARPRQGATQAGPRPLNTLTDLLGVRVITLFRDEVDVVAQLIEQEFTIDEENSVDKRAVLDPDKFGYLSLHYIAELSPGRIMMPEYRKYRGIKFEIQIRSILQHAWAEIEHPLGYKSMDAVPRDLRRRFARLASLLEVADEGFAAIKMEIGDHQTTAKEAIEQGGLSIEIDQDSLSAFVQSSPQTVELDKVIAKISNAPVQKRLDDQFLGRVAGQLKEQGFSSFQDLSEYLDGNEELLPKFVKHWLKSADQKPSIGRAPVPVPTGITLWYVGKLKYAQALPAETATSTGNSNSDQDRLRQALRDARSDTSQSPGR
jgi:putative GTP pyrophosphokinase